MVEMIREAGWEGFMALWEKFQEAVASSANTHKYSLIYFHLHTHKYKSAHTQIFICTLMRVHTHTNISSALTQIFPEMSEKNRFYQQHWIKQNLANISQKLRENYQK